MKFLSILAILFGFSQCGSTKLVNKPPFTINTATYTNWVGGLPGVSGTRVEIRLHEKSDVAFDSLFFQKKTTKVEIREEKGVTFLTAHFNTSKKSNQDRILHSDAKMELKNKLPNTLSFPFELEKNEAILSYQIGDNTKYFKIENILEAKPKFYPKTRK